VLVHPLAGVLSAYGMGLADQSMIREQAVECVLDPDAIAPLVQAQLRGTGRCQAQAELARQQGRRGGM
jgi:5-oxoprolinase (ATP-hydrolysing)